MFINSIALLQEFWSINKMLDLYTSHHLSSFFSFYSPFTFQKFNSYLALSNPLCSQVFSVKQWSSHSSSSDDLVNEILLPYPKIFKHNYFWCPNHMHRRSLQEQFKKHLKIDDLKSGTTCLWQWRAAQPRLNIFGYDLLSWVGLNCDGEIKTIQSLSSNWSMTETGPHHLPKISVSGLLYCLAYSWERVYRNGCVFQR